MDLIVLSKNSLIAYKVSMFVISPVIPAILSEEVLEILLNIILYASAQEVFSNLFFIFIYGESNL